MENRRRVAETLGLRTDNFFFLHQVHGHRVVEARRISHPSPHADAVITDKRGIALAIKTADCVPILLCDPERPAVAAIHSGWRGTAKNIIKGTISMMESKYRTKREKIIAAVGPAIGPCCYEVDRTVAAALLDEKELGPSEKDGKFFIDLTSLNIRQLKAEGLEEKNITAINLCTFCHKKFFFSHRRDHGLTGRQISVIMIL
jgi:YfiH family protein